jgi:glycosyltransferase involved in cell wall biosynthesis
MNPEPIYSVVVPFYNEAENLPPLIREIDAMLRVLEQPAEIVLVNDGSTDSFAQSPTSPAFPIRWLHLTQNSGQSAAMYYGMQEARGKYIILMDADLQNDPMDAPRLLKKLEAEQLDMVTGVRTKHGLHAEGRARRGGQASARLEWHASLHARADSLRRLQDRRDARRAPRAPLGREQGRRRQARRARHHRPPRHALVFPPPI